MIFPRTKLIDKFRDIFALNTTQYISIVGDTGMGKSTFITLLEESDIFEGVSVQRLTELNNPTLSEGHTLDHPDLIIIDSDIPYDYIKIRTYIESYSPESRVIFTSTGITHADEVEIFFIDGIAFREYAEGLGQPIEVSEIMSHTTPIEPLNRLRDAYIHTGENPSIINDPSQSHNHLETIISVMNQELFKKEEGDFMEFLRTIAMGIGDLYKEERIAKSMNLSRRKIRKYTEIILKHNLVHAIGPYVQNTDTELSRHVKLYFNDLATFAAILDVIYYHGEGKQGVLENFILLELERKVRETHTIRFYRKKSGAEIQFLLIDNNTSRLTPIIVNTRSTDVFPQSLKSFYETYGSEIDHSMIMNESIADQKQLDGMPVIFLPHVAI